VSKIDHSIAKLSGAGVPFAAHRDKRALDARFGLGVKASPKVLLKFGNAMVALWLWESYTFDYPLPIARDGVSVFY
jgi:hypothetical protein